MRKSALFLMTFLLLNVLTAWSQSSVTGRVVSDSGNTPISGATIALKNGKATTVSDADGSFTIAASAGSSLIVSHVGYDAVTVAVGSAPLEVRMTVKDAALSEVVVVGYGTRLKRDITGSIAKVSGRDINNTPATSFETAIQGRASGVLVQQQNGKLGQGINIRIRGASSVSAGNEPLYVVDGIPVISNDLSGNGAATDALADLNMNDIASIDILKDASATAIYGSQGSNGVVLITTKKGRSGVSKMEVNYFTGLQSPTGKRKFLNSREYVDFFKQAGVGAAKQDFAAGYYNTLQEAIDDYDSYIHSRFTRYAAGNSSSNIVKVNTDWNDQAFQHAPISQYDLNFSGGSDKTKYYASGQFLNQQGILIRNSYKRYSARLNLDQQAKDWLNFGMNMSFSRSENNRLSNDDAFSTPLQIVALSPITPVVDPRTGLLSGAFDANPGANYGRPNTNYPVYYNPLLSVENSSYLTSVNRTLGNVYANVTFTKGLTFRSEVGLDQLNQGEEGYYGSLTARNTGVSKGSGFYYGTQVLNITTNNYFTYNLTAKELHTIDLTGGMAFQKGRTLTSTTAADEFPSDAYQKLNAGATKTKASTGSTENTLLSYFLRGNYKFNDKYIVAVSGRIDGSSRFGANHRYGFFPAASVGWIVSQERFLSKVSWLSLFKIKASYGANGNDRIPDFPARALFAPAAYGSQAGQTPYQLPNADLKWETTVGTDIGFEAGLFKNRIGIEVDLYKRDTKDLLLSQQVPGTSGFATQYSNIGNLTNKGIEISVNTTNFSGKYFRWTSSLNFSANKNKITNLGGQLLGESVNKAMEGQPLGVFVAREYAGVDPANGDALYYKNTPKAGGTTDRSTTNNYNDATDVVIGNPNPKFFYGFNNTFSYKALMPKFYCRAFMATRFLMGAASTCRPAAAMVSTTRQQTSCAPGKTREI